MKQLNKIFCFFTNNLKSIKQNKYNGILKGGSNCKKTSEYFFETLPKFRSERFQLLEIWCNMFVYKDNLKNSSSDVRLIVMMKANFLFFQCFWNRMANFCFPMDYINFQFGWMKKKITYLTIKLHVYQWQELIYGLL